MSDHAAKKQTEHSTSEGESGITEEEKERRSNEELHLHMRHHTVPHPTSPVHPLTRSSLPQHAGQDRTGQSVPAARSLFTNQRPSRRDHGRSGAAEAEVKRVVVVSDAADTGGGTGGDWSGEIEVAPGLDAG